NHTYVHIPDTNRLWDGGNIIFPETIPVMLQQDGGQQGDEDTDCSFTYTASSFNGKTILTAASPINYRIPKCQYQPATYGLVFFGTNQNLQLLALDEGPLPLEACEEPQ
ncbi:MAG: hypothetical protein N3B01_09260, partial [Verrucomicrobiae bacterium]|nr:hypothetical protein [Verrucomicrobiae bacterium]